MVLSSLLPKLRFDITTVPLLLFCQHKATIPFGMTLTFQQVIATTSLLTEEFLNRGNTNEIYRLKYLETQNDTTNDTAT
jgi:hypothetical protein